MENSASALAEYISEKSSTICRKFYPEFHAAPPVGWINDPNGFVFYKGKYHLFCQFYPYAAQWGLMHWGHWTSCDLIKWSWCGVALLPDTKADEGGCFSGTACVYNDCLYLMYTGLTNEADGTHYQQQCIAYSEDGVHFKKCECNPVISKDLLPVNASPFDFRDPKVYRDGNDWKAIIAGKVNNRGSLLLYKSDDLLHWSYEGTLWQDMPSMPECPDYYTIGENEFVTASMTRMAMEGNKYPHEQCVIIAKGHIKSDNIEFITDGLQALDNGWDFYAPQTIETPDGRRVMIGWLQCWGHEMPTKSLKHGWNGCMTIPREITCKDGHLYINPVEELDNYHHKQLKYSKTIDSKNSLAFSICECADVSVDCTNIRANELSIRFQTSGNEYLELKLEKEKKILTVDTSKSGYEVICTEKTDTPCLTTVDVSLEESLYLRCIIDRSSLEIFVNHGEQVISTRIFPRDCLCNMNIFASEGSTDISAETYSFI